MQKRRKLKTAERQQVYDKFKGHCAYCGCEIEFKDMQVDHIEPLELGGADEIDNMYPACRSCNHYKHTLTIEKFRKALECMPNVLMRDSVTFKNAMRYGLIKSGKTKVVFFFEKVEKNKKRSCPYCDYLNTDNGMFCRRYNIKVTSDNWCYFFIPKEREENGAAQT